MNEIKYHPLVNCDSNGKEKSPMFSTTDESAVRRSHKLYLEEIVPRYYRLRSVEGTSAEDAKQMNIRCPICGKKMMNISSPVNENRLALYRCRNCENESKERKK